MTEEELVHLLYKQNTRDKHTLSTEELAGNVEILGSDNDDALAVEKLLRDDGSKTSKEMSLACTILR